MEPPGLPLKSMNSIFILLSSTTLDHPPLKKKKKKICICITKRERMHQCNGISCVTTVHCGEIERDRRREEGSEGIK